MRLPYLLLPLLAAAMFLPGINWGLPNRSVDRYLFGGRTPWTGAEILALAGPWDDSANRGSDIAMHVLADRLQPILLNGSDAQRAEIVRRFRLYSCQPDEMITFRALSRMKPGRGDFDPQFFQYGGLWVYPVGVLLKIASVLKLVVLKSDLAFYLDHPEEFGRFYIVARLYSVFWGLLGVWIVFAITEEWTGNRYAAVAASLLYMTMPVVVNAAHEAKPHLAGTVLTLLTILAAMKFVRTGKRRWWMVSAVAAGASASMVLTGVIAFAVLPAMTLLRPDPWLRRVKITITACMLGVGTFVLTSPYFPIDYFFHHEIIQSNVGNYSNFYKPKISMVGSENALRLIGAGTSFSFLTVVAMVLVLMFLAVRPISAPKGMDVSFFKWHRKTGLFWLLLCPGILVAIQFFLLADNKPAEYARFALTLDILLAIFVVAVISELHLRMKLPQIAGLLMIVVTMSIAQGIIYTVNFCLDSTSHSTRLQASMNLANVHVPHKTLLIKADPAPYNFPPVDLFSWEIMLLPQDSAAISSAAAFKVKPIDVMNDLEGSPISWANKPFEITRYTSPGTSP